MNSVTTQSPIFTKKMTYKNFLKYLIPSVLSMVFVSFYTTIDGFFVSNFNGSNAMAAINIIVPITCIGFGLSIMISTGAGAIVGMRMGENDKKSADEVFSFMFLALIVISVIFTVLGLVFLDDILKILGSNEILDPYTKPYGFMSILMIPFNMIKLFLESFARVDGNSKLAMTMSIIGLVLNIVFDYIFIVPLNMGILGAGIGTALAIAISGSIGIFYFFSKKSYLKFVKPKCDLKLLFFACYNGSSEMFTELSTGITTFLFNIILLKNLGEDGVSAMSVITYLFYFFIAVYFGIAVGTAPIISYNYGANNKDAIKKVVKYSFISIVGSSVIIFLVSFIFSKEIVMIFTREFSVIEIANYGLKLFSLCFLMIGINIFISTYFTAVGNGGLSVLISAGRSLIFVVLYMLLLLHFVGINGIWLTIPAAELTTIIFSIFIYNKYKDKNKILKT